jgi:eukaryotic-like serine/threonine-protein kinase
VLGTTLDGKYRIDKLLGSGAMGAVYSAEHTSTGRRVAVKVISSGDLTRNEMLIGRFQREARAAGSIDTQHITQVLDAGVDRESGLPFLVMEYLSGEDLSVLLKRLGPIAPDLALRIVAQACLGLQKAHEAGVVHRDIKPANLFLAKRDAGEVIVKLLDFGIAKVSMDQAQDAETAALTRTGSMLGSPLYMSPEQARGNNKDIDHRADIWSLGVVLYQALAGKTPWHDITALGQLILAICQDTPQPVQQHAPWVSAEVAAIVHKCMKQDASLRFQSAMEMFQAIRPLLGNSWTITDDMVVSLNDTARAQVAPRMVASLPPPRPTIASLSGSNPGAQAGQSTHDAATLSQSQGALPSTASGGSSKATLGIAAALVAVLGVGGTYALMHRGAGPAATPAQVQQIAPPPPTTAPPAVTAPPTAVTAAAPPADASPKRVKLVIMPPDAVAEVEGKRVVAKNGIIEIIGAPGSVHRVKLSKGKTETEVEVIVTESGAMPPKVELTFGGAAPKPSASAAAAPGGVTPPPAPSGIVQKFE